MVVECQDERSQYKNKDRALKSCAAALREKTAGTRRRDRRGAPFSGRHRHAQREDPDLQFPQGRVTDHRIGLTLYRIDAIMNGDLDELLDAVRAYDMAEKLRAGASEG
jgi:peptide chain release factor 1